MLKIGRVVEQRMGFPMSRLRATPHGGCQARGARVPKRPFPFRARAPPLAPPTFHRYKRARILSLAVFRRRGRSLASRHPTTRGSSRAFRVLQTAPKPTTLSEEEHLREWPSSYRGKPVPLELAWSRAGKRSPGLPSSMHGGVFIHRAPNNLVGWTHPPRVRMYTGKELEKPRVLCCTQDPTRAVHYKDGLLIHN